MQSIEGIFKFNFNTISQQKCIFLPKNHLQNFYLLIHRSALYKSTPEKSERKDLSVACLCRFEDGRTKLSAIESVRQIVRISAELRV